MGDWTVCGFCGAIIPSKTITLDYEGSHLTCEISTIECSCGATWAIQRPRAVKADARRD